jgi:hypothetical protein
MAHALINGAAFLLLPAMALGALVAAFKSPPAPERR